jgi:hypothetical protein
VGFSVSRGEREPPDCQATPIFYSTIHKMS